MVYAVIRYLPKPIRTVVSFCGLMWLLISVFWGAITLFPFWITLRFIDEAKFLKLSCWLQEWYLVHFVTVCSGILGIDIIISGDVPPKESALYITNHLSQDWPAVYLVAWSAGTLGFVRTVVKKVMVYLPGLGQAMIMYYWPLATRDGAKDTVVLKKLFNTYKKSSLPVALWLFPEGTRMTKGKLASSQAYQKEKGYPVWEHVMLPRHRGFTMGVRALEGVARWVVDTTLVYEGWPTQTPSIYELMTADASKRHVLHVHLKKTPMSTLTAMSDEEQRQWLMDAWAQKEERVKKLRSDIFARNPRAKMVISGGGVLPLLGNANSAGAGNASPTSPSVDGGEQPARAGKGHQPGDVTFDGPRTNSSPLPCGVDLKVANLKAVIFSGSFIAFLCMCFGAF